MNFSSVIKGAASSSSVSSFSFALRVEDFDLTLGVTGGVGIGTIVGGFAESEPAVVELSSSPSMRITFAAWRAT